MCSSTIFRNFTIPVENKSLILIGNDIASEKYKPQVEEIRQLIARRKTEQAQEKKKQLLAFTPSATFKEKRQLPFLETYSGFVHLDFDKLTAQQLQDAFETIAGIPYTALCFVSPSGNGLKVFIEVDTDMEYHDEAYRQVVDFYEQKTGLQTDASCKDVTRLCFMSYDPNLYKNIHNEKFCVSLPDPTPAQTLIPIEPKKQLSGEETEGLNTEFIFQQQVQFTNQKKSYTDGNRNNYIYLLAANCNRAGLSALDTTNLIARSFDLPFKEIQAAVNSAFIHHAAEHSKFKIKSLPHTDNENPDVSMPVLPDDVFDAIPGFLKDIVKVAATPEERDILLLGSLVTLSVAFPTISGRYRDNTVNANLFIFITAKASAGKGILIHCRKLINPIHQDLRTRAIDLKRKFESDMLEYHKNKSSDPSVEKPQKPPQLMLFIPANNSATGFLEILGDSDSRGIIFETEGDTLANAFKTDYGDFSDGFRNAFQHEPISYYRRTDKEYVEINRPCLSAMLSGTPKQIQALIPSAENGLFSRFMFYQMNMSVQWDDVFATKTEFGLDRHFEALGNQFYALYHALKSQPDICFSLTESQQKRFNDFFRINQSLYITIHEDDYIGTVRRLGLTAFRMMMIFSALRIMETGEIPDKLVCSDEDFENTLRIIAVLLRHSSYVYTQIAEPLAKPKGKKKSELFLEALPYKFNRQDYVIISKKLDIIDKTAQGYLKKFVDAGAILHSGHDQYINPAANPAPEK